MQSANIAENALLFILNLLVAAGVAAQVNQQRKILSNTNDKI
ncbi:MAG TPA: hypothetical protein VM940_17000 [Chthoniobacterales bacterium]|jgi:archaellum component FlaG (FlaF/FlaG flagellin family)|nr:hypothetical protein [Chthoniobacterales bacterium]